MHNGMIGLHALWHASTTPCSLSWGSNSQHLCAGTADNKQARWGNSPPVKDSHDAMEVKKWITDILGTCTLVLKMTNSNTVNCSSKNNARTESGVWLWNTKHKTILFQLCYLSSWDEVHENTTFSIELLFDRLIPSSFVLRGLPAGFLEDLKRVVLAWRQRWRFVPTYIVEWRCEGPKYLACWRRKIINCHICWKWRLHF